MQGIPVLESIRAQSGSLPPVLVHLAVDEAPFVLIASVPALAETGKPIKLDGSKSVTSKETKFVWTVVQQPEGSQLPAVLGEGASLELTLDFIGSYKLALTMDDGIKRESRLFSVEVADRWLDFNEPIVDLAVLKDNLLAVLYGLQSKLAIYKDFALVKTIELNELCKEVAATRESNVIAVRSDNRVRVFDLDLNEIDQFTITDVSYPLAMTDDGRLYVQSEAKGKDVYWSGPGQLEEIEFHIDRDLLSAGNRVFYSYYGFEMITDADGLPTGSKSISTNGLLAANASYLVSSVYVLKLLPENKMEPLYLHGKFAGGACISDSGVAVSDSTGISVHRLQDGKTLKTIDMPRFGLKSSRAHAVDMELLADGTLCVLYQPADDSDMDSVIVGFYYNAEE